MERSTPSKFYSDLVNEYVQGISYVHLFTGANDPFVLIGRRVPPFLRAQTNTDIRVNRPS